MTIELIRQALRRHRWSLAGPAATQLIGALVLCTTAMAQSSITQSLPAAHRDGTVANALEFLGIFHGNARFLSLIVIGVTMTLTMVQQLPDIALLRSLGASPAQTRTNLVMQAVIVAVPAVLAGFVLAVPLTELWLSASTARGVLPHAVHLHVQPSTLVYAMIVVLIASALGTLAASLPTSQRAPARALTLAGARNRPIGRVRTVIGASLVGSGLVLSVVLSMLSAKIADAAGIFVLLGESAGVGLLGPLLVNATTRLLRPIAGNGRLRLALDNLDAQARPLSGALVPLVLAISFATIQNSMVDTAARAGGADASSADRWLTLCGTVSTALFAAVAALNCLITIGVGRRREQAVLRAVGADRRTLLGIASWEALIFAGTALVVAAAVSLCTLVPVLGTAYHRWLPYLPPTDLAGGVLAVLALVAFGTIGTAYVGSSVGGRKLGRVDRGELGRVQTGGRKNLLHSR